MEDTEHPTEAASGEKLPVEKWAERKGLWPQFGPAPTYPVPAAAAAAGGPVAVNLAGLVGPRPNPDYWKFAAAKVHERWPEGKELTEEEFDRAIEIVTGHVAR
jgi:hypothetical protein